ncbi:endonuclease [Nocardioides houyundeii]|uniref:endonuclease n=1 Tax=Nocardioides houyundeii TaxID=2045452 RepID=UPI000C7759F2|nr:endonuclease [Nocardioides houyundeii]
MSDADVVQALLTRHGTTYAEAAGIALEDEPAPLWQLLVLSLLLSARIRSEVAVATARELFAAGCTTPPRTRDLPRRSLVAALGRGGYRRYDERTAGQLGQLALKVLGDHAGDLRRMHERCEDNTTLAAALQEFTGIGPAGAAIFLREVQFAWPDVAPYADDLAARGAQRLGLPTSAQDLARLVPRADLPRLVAACVRAARATSPLTDVPSP